MNTHKLVSLIIVLLLLNLNLTNGFARPSGRSGVYMYRNKHNHKIHYIGMTNNFNRRQNEHLKDGRYFADRKTYYVEKINMPSSNEKERRLVEKTLIEHNRPPGNRQFK